MTQCRLKLISYHNQCSVTVLDTVIMNFYVTQYGAQTENMYTLCDSTLPTEIYNMCISSSQCGALQTASSALLSLKTLGCRHICHDLTNHYHCWIRWGPHHKEHTWSALCQWGPPHMYVAEMELHNNMWNSMHLYIIVHACNCCSSTFMQYKPQSQIFSRFQVVCPMSV